MRIRIKKGSRTIIERTLNQGWNHDGTCPLGWQRFGERGPVRQSAGIADGPTGNVYCDSIELKEDGLLGKTTTWGVHDEVIPVRSNLTLRLERANVQSPDTFKVGRMKYPYARSFMGVSPLSSRETLGMWSVNGGAQPDAPGGDGIEFCPGRLQDGAAAVVFADQIMSRMALDFLDPSTGFPVPMHLFQTYDCSRGWSKTTQIDSFCTLASLSAWDDTRVPKRWNAGACSYEDRLIGKKRWDGYLPFDDQHLIRGIAPVMSAAMAGDPVHRFNLSVIANDALLGRPLPESPFLNITPPESDGSSYFGTRGAAWAAYAMIHSEATSESAQNWRDNLYRVQMPNGMWQRQSTPSYWSPDPWAPRTDGTVPFGPLEQGASTDEAFISVHVLCQMGGTVTAQTAMRALFEIAIPIGMMPAFVVVADRGVPVHKITKWWGGQHFHVWGALGSYAAVLPNDEEWPGWCLSIRTPGGHLASDLTDLVRALESETQGRDQTCTLVSVLRSLGHNP